MRSLDQIVIGSHAIIVKLHTSLQVKHRLTELGFIPGTKITCVSKSILGNPRAYKIRGNVIAIRNEDAKNIEIT